MHAFFFCICMTTVWWLYNIDCAFENGPKNFSEQKDPKLAQGQVARGGGAVRYWPRKRRRRVRTQLRNPRWYPSGTSDLGLNAASVMENSARLLACMAYGTHAPSHHGTPTLCSTVPYVMVCIVVKTIIEQFENSSASHLAYRTGQQPFE